MGPDCLPVSVSPVLETVPSSSVSVREGQGATLHCRWDCTHNSFIVKLVYSYNEDSPSPLSALEGWPPPTLAWVRPGGEKVFGGILDLPLLTRY